MFLITSETEILLILENLTMNMCKALTKVMVSKSLLFSKTKSGLETKQVEHRFSQEQTRAHIVTCRCWLICFVQFCLTDLPFLQLFVFALIVRLRYQFSLSNSYRIYSGLSHCIFSSKPFLAQISKGSRGTTDRRNQENNSVT